MELFFVPVPLWLETQCIYSSHYFKETACSLHFNGEYVTGKHWKSRRFDSQLYYNKSASSFQWKTEINWMKSGCVRLRKAFVWDFFGFTGKSVPASWQGGQNLIYFEPKLKIGYFYDPK